MEYQRAQLENEKPPDREAMEAYDKAMKHPVNQALEVEKFGFDNPGDAKYKRKVLIEWRNFKRKYCTRHEATDKDKAKPYTWQAFQLYGENVQGLSPAETKAWWQSFYDNPAIERDNSGPFGRLVLYCPIHKSKSKAKTKFIENAYEEGSSDKRKPTQKDRKMLLEQVGHQRVTHADEFFLKTSNGTHRPRQCPLASRNRPRDFEEKGKED